jgi:hypothetical protein
MSLAAYEFFKALAGRVIYTNIARPTEIIDLATNAVEIFTYQPSIKEFLAGYGFELRKPPKSVEEAERRAFAWDEAARAVAIAGSVQLDLDDQVRRKAREKGIQLTDELHIADPTARAAVAQALELRQENDQVKGKLSKYGVQFLTGGWLEVFMWNQLRRHQDPLGLWDVGLGLEVGHTSANTGNDIDVAFMHNCELWVVECKTGGQEHDPGGDVLYKLEAVINQFGALRVRSLLATTSENILDRHGEVKPNVENRVRISGCKLLPGKQIAEMATRFEDAASLRSILATRHPTNAAKSPPLNFPA